MNSAALLMPIIKSLRIKHWVKNLFVFSGIMFSQNIFVIPMLIDISLTFIAFCILSSSVYIINDLADIEKDRHHPVKCKRPIAAGELKKSSAVMVVLILISIALIMSYRLGLNYFLLAMIYIFVQIPYSFHLKHLVILDVFCIAAGFFIRVVAGAVVINVEMSSWLIICTIFLSIFLGLAKRRHEIEILDDIAVNHRKVLLDYSPYLLDQLMMITASATVVCYALYTTSQITIAKFGTKKLIYTIPFVVYGIFRYLYLVHIKGKGGNPENILVEDIPMFVNIALWILTIGIILYF